jgi:solute carrier family 25 carnitine/acylcarnitine transporter 20/29
VELIKESNKSLHNYRRFLLDNGFAERSRTGSSDSSRLSLLGHSIAGMFAGWTK